jgi:branched-chain amino acid transport system substrate-binding protein
MQAMKHHIFAFTALFLLGACETSSLGPWKSSQTADFGAAQETPRHFADKAALGQTALSGQPSVKVALLVPLSSPNKDLGQSMMNAAQLALFDMGYENFELLPEDSGNDAASARVAAQNVLNEGADLILGPVFADAVAAVKPLAAQKNVNVIAFSTDWKVAGGNTFLMSFVPFDQVKRIASYNASLGRQKVGILEPQTEYGRTVTKEYQAVLKSLGLPAAQVTRLPDDPQQLPAAIQSFAQSGAYDSVFIPVGGERALAVASLLTQAGLTSDKVSYLSTGLWDDTGLAHHAVMSNALFAAPQPDLRNNFLRNYRQTYGGNAPPRLASLAYDATALAAVLARQASSADPAHAFNRAALLNPNGFAGIDGIFRFGPNGIVQRGQAVLTFKNMSIDIVDRAPRTFQNQQN